MFNVMESLQAVFTLVILQIFIRGLWSGGNVSGLFNHVLMKKYISSVENDAFFLKEIVSKHLKHCLWYNIQYPKEDKGYRLIRGKEGMAKSLHFTTRMSTWVEKAKLMPGIYV